MILGYYPKKLFAPAKQWSSSLGDEATFLTETDLKPRFNIHLARRIWHLFGVLSIIAIFNFASYKTSLILLAITFICFVIPDFMRLRNPRMNQVTLRWFKPFLRQSEANSLSGLSYLHLGTTIIVLLFHPQIVTLSLFFVAFGDPISSIFGVMYGKDKIVGDKTLQGAFAGFLVCGLVAYIYYLYNGLMLERVFLAAIVSGVIGAVSEVFPVRKLDDNLTFPVISSFLLFLMFHLFGAFA